MRRFDITMATGDPDTDSMLVYRDVPDDYVRHDYELIRSLPNVISVAVTQKDGENWRDYVRFLESLPGGGDG
jgi:hypothetical protein